MIGRLIGMVHLGPLPGSARSVPLDETIDRAVSDAVDLVASPAERLETWIVEEGGKQPKGVRFAYVERCE